MTNAIRSSVALLAAAILLVGCGSGDEPPAPAEGTEEVSVPSPTPASPALGPESTVPFSSSEPIPAKYKNLAEEVRILQGIILYDEDTDRECLLFKDSSLKLLAYPAVGGIYSQTMGYNVRSVYVDQNQELDVVDGYPECVHGREVYISDTQWVGETGQLEQVAEAA